MEWGSLLLVGIGVAAFILACWLYVNGENPAKTTRAR